MKYVKPFSLFEYAKRLRQSLLSIDLGKRRSGVCVAYPHSGVIFPARSPDGSIYSFEHDRTNRADDILCFSTSLNVLAEYYNAAGFNFGFPYEYKYRNQPNLGIVVREYIWDLHCCCSEDGWYPQYWRLFTAVNEQSSSHFGEETLLVDYFKTKHKFADWTEDLHKAYVNFLSSPSEAATINFLQMMRGDSYAAIQFSKWYFNYCNGTGTGPKFEYRSYDQWDGDFEASQLVIERLIQGDLGVVAVEI